MSTIHEHRDEITAASGETSSITLPIVGGILKQTLIQANTSTTVFKVNLTDSNGVKRLEWSIQTGCLNDLISELPMRGQYTLNITNASPDDTFTVVLGIEE